MDSKQGILNQTKMSTANGRFFKGYRPNFYFRTNKNTIFEKPLSKRIIERINVNINL